jgi:hypothetical protein
MAKDVRAVARSTLSVLSSTVTIEPDSAAEIELPRDELTWPVNPSAGIDIFSGIVLPIHWEQPSSGYASSALVYPAVFESYVTGGPNL